MRTTIGDPQEHANALSDIAAEIAPDLPERAMALFEQAAHAELDLSRP